MIWGIIKKEFIHLSRDRRTIFLSTFSPIVFLCLMNYFAIDILKKAAVFENGIYISGIILCMILTMMMFLSILTGALETGVGEKERGTLCSTLRTGVGFPILFWGKYLTLVIQGLVSLIVLDISMFGLSLIPNSFFMVIFKDEQFVHRAVMINIILIVCILCFSALELMLSFFVRNFKEGQVISIPLMFLVLVPFYIVMNSQDSFVSGVIYFIPFINTPSILSDVILGRASIFNLIKYVGINGIIIFIAIKVIFAIMNKESSLFRR